MGRKLLYPRDFGLVTAGSANTCHVGISYDSLRIFSSAENLRRVLRRMSRTAFSAESFWGMDPTSSRSLSLDLVQTQLTASIRCTEFEVQLELVESENLRQENDRIHQKAIIWISELERRMRRALQIIDALTPSANFRCRNNWRNRASAARDRSCAHGTHGSTPPHRCAKLSPSLCDGIVCRHRAN